MATEYFLLSFARNPCTAEQFFDLSSALIDGRCQCSIHCPGTTVVDTSFLFCGWTYLEACFRCTFIGNRSSRRARGLLQRECSVAYWECTPHSDSEEVEVIRWVDLALILTYFDVSNGQRRKRAKGVFIRHLWSTISDRSAIDTSMYSICLGMNSREDSFVKDSCKSPAELNPMNHSERILAITVEWWWEVAIVTDQ